MSSLPSNYCQTRKKGRGHAWVEQRPSCGQRVRSSSKPESRGAPGTASFTAGHNQRQGLPLPFERRYLAATRAEVALPTVDVYTLEGGIVRHSEMPRERGVRSAAESLNSTRVGLATLSFQNRNRCGRSAAAFNTPSRAAAARSSH
jgi:hypothetical protein